MSVSFLSRLGWHVFRMAPSCSLLQHISTPSMQKKYSLSLGHPNDMASHESNRQQQAAPPQQGGSSHHFTLRASYLGSDIDINASSLKPMLRSRSLLIGRDYCVFTLKPSLQMAPPADMTSSTASTEAFSPSGSVSGLGLGAAGDEEMLLDEAKKHGICVAFKFGSVVFVVPRSKESQAPTLTSSPSSQDHHHQSDLSLTAHVSPSASEEKAAAEERACELLQGNLASILRPPNKEATGAASLSDCVGVEEAHLVVRPSMKRDFAKDRDRVVVPDLDIGNLEVICRVLGQSAALDFYTRATEQQVEALDVVLAELASNAGKPFYLRPLLFRRLRGGKLLSRIASSSIVYNKVRSKVDKTSYRVLIHLYTSIQKGGLKAGAIGYQQDGLGEPYARHCLAGPAARVRADREV
jgi:hypothetical protein